MMPLAARLRRKRNFYQKSAQILMPRLAAGDNKQGELALDILMTIFKWVGGLVVFLVVALIAGIFLFRLWLKRKIGAAGLAAMKYAGNSTPARVTLYRSDSDWHHADDAVKLEAAIGSLGFMPADKYEVEEMQDIQLSAFFHPAQSAFAVVYDHPVAGVWFDMVTKYPDDTTASTSTVKTPTLIEIPGDLVIKNTAFSVREAWDTLLAQRKPGPWIAMDADNFVAVFEASYARYMDHVLAKGSIDQKFVRESGKALGMKGEYSDEQYDEAQRIEEERMRQQISDACLDNFIKQSKLTAAQWEACRERALVIHERMTVDEAVENFTGWAPEFASPPYGPKAGCAETDARITAAKAETTDPLELFDKLNTLLPSRRAFLKLGDVKLPVRANVMLAPR
jgi:hypothetical protein